MVWKRVGSILRFCYDDARVLPLDSTCLMVGNHLKYLLAVLNSNMGNYMLQSSPKTGTGDLIISVQAIDPIKVPLPTGKQEASIAVLVDKVLAQSKDTDTQSHINMLVYKLYGLTAEEIAYIESKKV